MQREGPRHALSLGVYGDVICTPLHPIAAAPPPYPKSVALSAQGMRGGGTRCLGCGATEPVADPWHQHPARAASACTRSRAACMGCAAGLRGGRRRYTPPATVTSLFRKWCKASTPARSPTQSDVQYDTEHGLPHRRNLFISKVGALPLPSLKLFLHPLRPRPRPSTSSTLYFHLITRSEDVIRRRAIGNDMTLVWGTQVRASAWRQPSAHATPPREMLR